VISGSHHQSQQQQQQLIAASSPPSAGIFIALIISYLTGYVHTFHHSLECIQCSRKRVRQLKKMLKVMFFWILKKKRKKRTGRPTQPIVSQAT